MDSLNNRSKRYMRPSISSLSRAGQAQNRCNGVRPSLSVSEAAHISKTLVSVLTSTAPQEAQTCNKVPPRPSTHCVMALSLIAMPQLVVDVELDVVEAPHRMLDDGRHTHIA